MPEQPSVPVEPFPAASDSAAERRFRALLENGPVGVLLVGPDARVIYTTASLLRMFDRPAEELVGADALDLIEPADRARLAALFQDLIREPASVRSAELRVRRGDGMGSWIEATARNLLHDPDVQAVLVTTREIEDRKRMELELRRAAAIVESSGDAIITKTLVGAITTWNAGAERIYGYTAEEAVGMDIRDMTPAERRTEIEDILERIRRGEQVDHFETVRLRKDGARVHVSLRVSPLLDPDGSIVGASVIARDVSERHAAEEAVRASEQRYRRLFDENPIPMWVYDPQTLRFLAVNEAAVAHYGYTRDEFLEMTIADIRPEEDVASLTASIGRDERGDVWRHRLKDGTVIDVEVHSHAIVFDGRPARVVMATDITRRRRAEEELRLAYQAERQAAARLRALDDMKNMFLNAVSHELRTPLASVLGSSLTLERLGPQLTEKERADLLRAVTSNARKLERMLSDLLDLDRLTRGVTRPRLEAVELGELVASVVAEPEFQVGRRIEVETHPMVFKVDRSKVQRIVENLLANAIRHTPPGTPIWVRVRRVSEGARIEVDDAGSGIAPEIRGTIFEPFAQGPDRRDHAPGVGIGLSLVKRFAELHRGTAWVEDRPGGGAAFRVLLREPTAPGPDE